MYINYIQSFYSHQYVFKFCHSFLLEKRLETTARDTHVKIVCVAAKLNEPSRGYKPGHL